MSFLFNNNTRKWVAVALVAACTAFVWLGKDKTKNNVETKNSQPTPKKRTRKTK